MTVVKLRIAPDSKTIHIMGMYLSVALDRTRAVLLCNDQILYAIRMDADSCVTIVSAQVVSDHAPEDAWKSFERLSLLANVYSVPIVAASSHKSLSDKSLTMPKADTPREPNTRIPYFYDQNRSGNVSNRTTYIREENPSILVVDNV